MSFQTWNARVLGLVFDISLRHCGGKRILDIAKESVREYLRSNWEDDDIFYMYHPLVTEPTYKRGESVSVVSNYETDGWKFDLSYALKQTLYVISNEDESFEKNLLLISDRLDSDRAIKSVINVQKTDFVFDCNLKCLGLTSNCDLSLLPEGWVGWEGELNNLTKNLEELLTYGEEQDVA